MKKLDLGTEKISKLIIAFSIPCIISMLINSVYNIVDQIFIGQGVGYLGNAATNIIFPLVIMCNAIASILGNGCAAELSLKLGEGKKDEAKKSVGGTITTIIFVSLLFGILSYVFLPTLIKFFGCTESVMPYAMAYGKIIVIGAPFMIIYSALSSIIRADGSPKYSMFCLVIGAILNIILDYIFIMLFNMGVEGGALATVIGQVISFIIAIIYIPKIKSFKLDKKDFLPRKTIIKTLSYGVSSFITQMTILVLFIFMNNIMTKYGALSEYGADIPLSVYGVISKVTGLYISSVLGVAIGAQPIIGYNYGAGKYGRVRETLKKVLIINFTIGFIFNVIFLVFPKQIVSIFGSSDNALYIKFATDFCRIFLLVSMVNALEMTSSVVIQSFGNVKKSTAVSFIRQIILFIPLALIFSRYFGLYGAIYAGPLADFICFIIVIFIFNSEYVKIKNKEEEENSIVFNDIAPKESSSKLIITINREYGSGGRYVGKILANLLNANFYDKEIITITASNTGLTEDYINENEQKITKRGNIYYNNDNELFVAESQTIKKLSKNTPCVIVGRCANYVLKNNKNVVRIFLYSSDKDKEKRAIKYYGLDKKNALKEIEKINKQREKHYKYYTNEEWKQLDNYDYSFNVDKLGVKKTAEIIKDIVINLSK